jgi:hypothetical protein
MKRTRKNILPRAVFTGGCILLATVFPACDVAVSDTGGSGTGGANRSPDSGVRTDAGTRSDAGTVCDFVGCDCAVVPCAPGLSCGADDRCFEAPACADLGVKCEFDEDCCPASDPALGVWCGAYAECAQCSAREGRCTSDYDCCPLPDDERPLMCTSRALCKPICENDVECPEGETCMLSGECVPIPCSGDSQCPGEHCCSGTCKPDCGYGPPEACAITTPGGAIFKDRPRELHAVAWRGDAKKGAQMVPWTQFTWSSSDAQIVSVDSSTGEIIGGAAEGEATISARTGQFDCGSTAVVNFLPVTPGTFRVIVFDAETGGPVDGADVVIGTNPPVRTDAAGVAITTSPPDDVHVFHDGYTWVSLVGLGLSDYIVYLKPKPDDTVAGGYRGKFDFTDEPRGYQFGRACTISNIHPWDAPLSVVGSLLFFDVGPDVRCDELFWTHVRWRTDEGSALDFDDWLPTAGGFMANQDRIGAKNLIPTYRVLGRQGLRAAWAIAGGLPSRDIQILWRMLTIHPDPIAPYEGDYQPGVVGVAMLRFLQNLGHAVQSVFEIVPVPKIDTPLADNGEPLVPSPTMADYAEFPELDLEPANRPALKTILDLQKLPQLGPDCLSGVYAESQTILPGMGTIVLGKNGGFDNPDDPSVPGDCAVTQPDYFEGNPENVADGQIALRTAPNHDGLETNPFRILLLASDFARTAGAVDTAASGFPLNGVIGGTSQPLSGRIVNLGPVVPHDVQVAPFLALPEGAGFDLASRTVAAPGTMIAGAVAYRYTVKNAAGEWEIFTDSNMQSVVLPLPPASHADRATDSGMTVHAFSTRGALLGDLFSPAQGGELDALGEVVDAFSRLTCLKKIPADDPDYAKKCQQPNPDDADDACDPACEVR